MKHLIITFLLSTLCQDFFSQNQFDTLNQTDANGKKQGYWKIFKRVSNKDVKNPSYNINKEVDSMHIVIEEGVYRDNKKTGKWTEYYYNGLKKNILTFIDGRPNGEAYMFHEDGVLSEKGTWKMGKWLGEYFLFYHETGNIAHKFYFNENGKREGLATYYYPTGIKAVEAIFINGKENGMAKQYYQNGIKSLETNYNNGLKEGNQKLFNIYGKFILKQEYKNDTLVSKMNADEKKLYNYLMFQIDSLDKTIKKTESLKSNGIVLSGEQTTYNKNKQISKQGKFYNNTLYDGKAYSYDANGKLERIAIYKGGQYIDDEFNVNESAEDKIKREMMKKLRETDEKMYTDLSLLFNETSEKLNQKEVQLNAQIVENKNLTQEKQLKELLLKQKENEINQQIIENQKRQLEFVTLNKDKHIKEIELKKQKVENEKKEQSLKLVKQERQLKNEQLKQEKKQRYFLYGGLVLILVFASFIYKNLHTSKKQNRIIALQKQEVEKQKEITELQKILVEEKQHEIIQSITYAKRLQQAILPSMEFITQNVPKNFILYKPKDIVAGDFYWSEKIGDLFFIAAADCTGHGVPGAMVSVVCSNALNRTVKEFGLTDTGKILDKTRELVIETFEKSNAEVKDGMDISLLCIDNQNQKIFWSGANNPLWYIQDKQLLEIKADKQPVGKSYDTKPFKTNEIVYKANSIFYLFTDGLADQFGGPKGKKYKYKQFEDLLVSIDGKTMKEQSDIISERFENWKGILEQVDDICVIGIKI